MAEFDFKSIEERKSNVSEDKRKLYQSGTSKEEATVRLKELIKNNDNKPIIIKSKDGEEARLSGTSIGKLVSDAAVQKSMANGFTKEQHFAAAADIDNLFRNAKKISSRPDKYGDNNVTIHRFSSPLFGDNTAYITVKEVSEYGKRIYSVELMEIGKLEGIIEGDKKSSSRATSNPTHNIQKNT